MKKYILALGLVGLLIVPLAGQAVSLADLSLMVEQMTNQVSSLQPTQLGAVSLATGSASFPALKQQTYSTLGRGLDSVMATKNMSQLIAKTDSIISQFQALRKQMSTSTPPIYTITPTLVSTSAVNTVGDGANDDIGTFTVKFKVKAVGGPVYLSSVVTGNYTYVIDRDGVATSSNSVTATLANITDNNKTAVGNYKIEDGSEETLKLTVTVPMGMGIGGAGPYRATLAGLKWGTVDSVSLNKVRTGLNYRTDFIYLN